MNKEQLQSQVEIQKNLWGKICGDQGLTKRVEQARLGHLPNGLTLPELTGKFAKFNQVLGEFAPRVLIVSNPNNPFTLSSDQIAIVGGWCALRTRDIADLSQRCVIMSPETGELSQIKSVEQVNEWIENSVTFDQVVESVGAVNGSEYAVISERQLWVQRIKSKLAQVLGKRITRDEQNQIEDAVENAEVKRSQLTERYLSFVTGKPIMFNRIVDEDIKNDLKRAQVETFSKAGLSLQRLKNRFPKDAATIDSSAIVWAMYSEPYLNVLRERGFLSKKTAFIVEPSLHTYADTQAGNEVVQRIYQEKGIYLNKKGFNENTGFIAFMECVNSNGQNVRKHLGVGEVPNVSNWQMLIASGLLAPERNLVISPKENQLFVWGTNILPFGKTQASLLRLVDLQGQFQEEKAKIASVFSPGIAKKDPNVRTDIQRKVEELRQQFLIQVGEENDKIARGLQNLFVLLTQ